MENKKGNVMPEMAVMQPTVINEEGVTPVRENVSSKEIVCRCTELVKKEVCPEYGGRWCLEVCPFGGKEKPMDDVNLDYSREDGK
jgi:hypothetical protein